MSNARQDDTLAKALVAAVGRLGATVAVFQPSELMAPTQYSVRCHEQADGSVAIIMEPKGA